MTYLDKLKHLASPSKYLTWYTNIILNATNRASSKTDAIKLLGYVESHHILPRSLCESKQNEKDKKNIAFLSPKEHFICHLLLAKAYPCVQTSRALYGMCTTSRGRRYKSARSYESLKLLAKQDQSKRRLHPDAPSIFKTDLNPAWSDASMARMTGDNPMSKLRTNGGTFKPGRIHIVTDEMKQKQSVSKTGDKNPNYGNKSASSHLNAVKFKCIHCGAETIKGNITRWHNDNCKQKPNQSKN